MAVYPCTYRERFRLREVIRVTSGISLYLQGTRRYGWTANFYSRYIPVPTGNAKIIRVSSEVQPGISLYLQGTLSNNWLVAKRTRYIPVPTGNAIGLMKRSKF